MKTFIYFNLLPFTVLKKNDIAPQYINTLFKSLIYHIVHFPESEIQAVHHNCPATPKVSLTRPD